MSTDAWAEHSRNLAVQIRRHALQMVHCSGASHIGSCLSAADLLAALYAGWLNVDPQDPQEPDRDRFIMSKGHAAAALYACLAERGFFPATWLEEYCADGARLGGHVTHTHVPGVEVSSGSLGHGLSIGVGMAHALKLRGSPARVVVMLSDGECDEGSVWEAVLFAPQLELDNLVVMVDHNKIQSLGAVDEIASLRPFAEKWLAFRWSVQEIDGHDQRQIAMTLSRLPFNKGRPSVLIAHTVKGKGVSFMEHQLAWHYKSPDAAQLSQALSELDAAQEQGCEKYVH